MFYRLPELQDIGRHRLWFILGFEVRSLIVFRDSFFTEEIV